MGFKRKFLIRGLRQKYLHYQTKLASSSQKSTGRVASANNQTQYCMHSRSSYKQSSETTKLQMPALTLTI